MAGSAAMVDQRVDGALPNAPADALSQAGGALPKVAKVDARSQTMTAPRKRVEDELPEPVEVWSAGRLGELRSMANKAADRGDMQEYRRLSDEYVKAVYAAQERRDVLGGRGKRGNK